MENTEKDKPLIEWHDVKGAKVGISGTQVVCIVENAEDMPIECFRLHILQGVYLTCAAAQQASETDFTEWQNARANDPPRIH